MRPLSAHEKYLFSLTPSNAQTPAAQRTAIAREGLAGKTKSDILAERLKQWREFRAKPENADLKRTPAWLVAARFEAFPGWKNVATIKAGKPLNVESIAAIAHNAIDWGRLRKHSRGSGDAFQPRVTEEDNGKTGWHRVVRRFACYLCVISPDRKSIAIQAKTGDKIAIHKIRNGCFLHDRQRHWINARRTTDWNLTEETAKIMARALRRRLPAGLDCTNDGRKVYVTEKSTGELYHFDCWSHAPLSVVREAFEKRAILRRQEARNAEIDRLLADRAAFVWVEYSDSILSGNCESESRRFRESLQKQLSAEGELGAVRADIILAMRDDNYTRRACRVAALRCLKS